MSAKAFLSMQYSCHCRHPAAMLDLPDCDHRVRNISSAASALSPCSQSLVMICLVYVSIFFCGRDFFISDRDKLSLIDSSWSSRIDLTSMLFHKYQARFSWSKCISTLGTLPKRRVCFRRKTLELPCWACPVPSPLPCARDMSHPQWDV